MKKRVLALMLVLGMTFSLAACGSSNDKKSDDTKTETTDKDSKEKMTTVKWNYGSSGNVLVTIAEEEGYFEDEGIDLTLVTGFGARPSGRNALQKINKLDRRVFIQVDLLDRGSPEGSAVLRRQRSI